MAVKEEVTLPTQGICTRCKFVSSQKVCKACVLLEGLNKGLPKLGIGKSSKAKRMLEEYNAKQEQNLLNDAVKELNETENNCQSTKCRSGLCNKRNGLVNNENKETKGCNKCSGNCERTKVSNLLEKYAINEGKTNTDGINNVKVDENFDISDEEVNVEEDDTCSASCGRMGSLQIGF